MEQGSNKKGTAHAEAGSVPVGAGDGFRRSAGIPNEKALPLLIDRKKRLWLMKGGYTWTILIMENVVFAANIKNLLLNTFRLNLRLTLLKQKLFPE